MTEELHNAIEHLYNTFSVYPLRLTMEGCPCCVSGTDKAHIHSKPLRDLDGNDLSRYAFKAITTWGNTRDFKHYLPRIFELLATTHLLTDTFVVLGKLEYAQWQEWPGEEKRAVTGFLLAWWSNLTQHHSGFDKEAFTGIYTLTGNMEQLLSRWKIGLEDNSFANYVDLVYNHYNDLTSRKTEFREIDHVAIEELLNWIKDNSTYLETGFFHFADKDSELAEKISATQYIFEHA